MTASAKSVEIRIRQRRHNLSMTQRLSTAIGLTVLAAFFAISLVSADQMWEVDRDCMNEVLGFMPDNLTDLPQQQREQVLQECGKIVEIPPDGIVVEAGMPPSDSPSQNSESPNDPMLETREQGSQGQQDKNPPASATAALTTDLNQRSSLPNPASNRTPLETFPFSFWQLIQIALVVTSILAVLGVVAVNVKRAR